MLPRILMVISYFRPYLGGTEQQALFLTERLRKKNLSVAVLTQSFPGLLPYEQIRGIDVHRKIHAIPYPKLFAVSYFLTCLWFLLRRRKTYDIIHCHLLQGFHSIAAMVMKYAFKKKVVIHIGATGQLSDFLSLQKGLGGKLLLKIMRRADRIVPLCNLSSREALAAGFAGRHIAQIPNGVDTDFFTPAAAPPAPRKILFLSRLDYIKGVDVLLEALALLGKNSVEFTCDLVGDGAFREYLEGLADRLGIADRLHFHGATYDILPHLQQAGSFVLPSRSEGMPNVLLEAMACGLPIIATAVGGIPDLIQDGRNGLLVPPDDAAALSAALHRLITDDALASRFGQCARSDAEKRYSLDVIADHYISLYQTLLGRPSKPA